MRDASRSIASNSPLHRSFGSRIVRARTHMPICVVPAELSGAIRSRRSVLASRGMANRPQRNERSRCAPRAPWCVRLSRGRGRRQVVGRLLRRSRRRPHQAGPPMSPSCLAVPARFSTQTRRPRRCGTSLEGWSPEFGWCRAVVAAAHSIGGRWWPLRRWRTPPGQSDGADAYRYWPHLAGVRSRHRRTRVSS